MAPSDKKAPSFREKNTYDEANPSASPHKKKKSASPNKKQKPERNFKSGKRKKNQSEDGPKRGLSAYNFYQKAVR